MSYFRMWGSFYNSPKVRIRLVRALGCSVPEARGFIAGLWTWAADSRPDGVLSGLRPDEVEDICGWVGEPGRLWSALREVGFVDDGEHGPELHDWLDNAEGFHRATRERKRREVRKSSPPAADKSEPQPLRDPRVMHACSTRASPVRSFVLSSDLDPSSSSESPSEEQAPSQPSSDERRTAEPRSPSTVPMPWSTQAVTDRDRDPSPPKQSPDVLRVFEHYRKSHPQAHKKPSPKSAEWRLIEARFREGYTAEDLCAAIDGQHQTPHNLGENDRGTKYLGLDIAVRSASQVDRFAETARSPPSPVMSTREQKGHRAVLSFLDRFEDSKKEA